MKKISKDLVICSVTLLGLLSIGTGIAAELTKTKHSDIKVSNKCEYPKSPATIFGIVATLALMMSQGILLAATGCSCCSRTKSTLSNMSLRLQGFARFLFFMAAIGLFICGTFRNSGLESNTRRKHSTSGDYYVYLMECYYVRRGIFAMAASFSGASVLLGIIYFISVSKNSNLVPNNGKDLVATINV